MRGMSRQIFHGMIFRQQCLLLLSIIAVVAARLPRVWFEAPRPAGCLHGINCPALHVCAEIVYGDASAHNQARMLRGRTASSSWISSAKG